ncbi:MAG: hypothetical protein KH031_07170 [Clostridiales bacterium]|nr:hypothetical protein [Clostridiales bacterium]
MLGTLISENYKIALFIVITLSIIAALIFIKLRNWYGMEYKHSCVIMLIIAAILYLISDESEPFVYLATLQVGVLSCVSDIVFVPHLIGRRIKNEYAKEAILHAVYTYAAIFIYFMLLKADDKHILYTIFS